MECVLFLNDIENRGEDFKHVEFKMSVGHLNENIAYIIKIYN